MKETKKGAFIVKHCVVANIFWGYQQVAN